MNFEPLTGFPFSSLSVATTLRVFASITSRRVGPGVFSVEAERDPTVATLAEGHMFDFTRRHLRGVEDEQLLSVLIANPKFLLVRRKRGSVSAMRNQLIVRHRIVCE